MRSSRLHPLLLARALPFIGAPLVGASLAVAGAQTLADPSPTARVVVHQLTGPITLDGRSEEPAWEAIEPLPVVSSFPVFGAPPSERTEFRMAYDDEYLYVAGRMYDSDPATIRATSLRRDDTAGTSDWFVLNLDTFLDRETTLAFGTTPAGIRTDVVITADGAKVDSFNPTWNTFWDAAVARDEAGWYAELRIPLSSRRFSERDGVVRRASRAASLGGASGACCSRAPPAWRPTWRPPRRSAPHPGSDCWRLAHGRRRDVPCAAGGARHP